MLQLKVTTVVWLDRMGMVRSNEGVNESLRRYVLECSSGEVCLWVKSK